MDLEGDVSDIGATSLELAHKENDNTNVKETKIVVGEIDLDEVKRTMTIGTSGEAILPNCTVEQNCTVDINQQERLGLKLDDFPKKKRNRKRKDSRPVVAKNCNTQIDVETPRYVTNTLDDKNLLELMVERNNDIASTNANEEDNSILTQDVIKINEVSQAKQTQPFKESLGLKVIPTEQECDFAQQLENKLIELSKASKGADLDFKTENVSDKFKEIPDTPHTSFQAIAGQEDTNDRHDLIGFFENITFWKKYNSDLVKHIQSAIDRLIEEAIEIIERNKLVCAEESKDETEKSYCFSSTNNNEISNQETDFVTEPGPSPDISEFTFVGDAFQYLKDESSMDSENEPETLHYLHKRQVAAETLSKDEFYLEACCTSPAVKQEVILNENQPGDKVQLKGSNNTQSTKTSSNIVIVSKFSNKTTHSLPQKHANTQPRRRSLSRRITDAMLNTIPCIRPTRKSTSDKGQTQLEKQTIYPKIMKH